MAMQPSGQVPTGYHPQPPQMPPGPQGGAYPMMAPPLPVGGYQMPPQPQYPGMPTGYMPMPGMPLMQVHE